MPEWQRVKDPTTGHEFTTANPAEGLTVLKKDAVDRWGNPLPAKYHTDKAGRPVPAEKKEKDQ